MKTILFMLFIAAGIALLLWAMNRSKTRVDLAPRKSKRAKDKLSTPVDTLLAHKNQMWETRRKRALRESREQQTFVPRFEQKEAPEYDGYSRRDRHHLTPTASSSKQSAREAEDDFKMTSIPFHSEAGGSAGPTKH